MAIATGTLANKPAAKERKLNEREEGRRCTDGMVGDVLGIYM